MLAGFSMPGVSIVDHPAFADGVHEDHYVVATDRGHAWGGRGLREPEPIRGEVQVGDDSMKEVKGGFASTEGVRTAARAG